MDQLLHASLEVSESFSSKWRNISPRPKRSQSSITSHAREMCNRPWEGDGKEILVAEKITISNMYLLVIRDLFVSLGNASKSKQWRNYLVCLRFDKSLNLLKKKNPQKAVYRRNWSRCASGNKEVLTIFFLANIPARKNHVIFLFIRPCPPRPSITPNNNNRNFGSHSIPVACVIHEQYCSATLGLKKINLDGRNFKSKFKL